VHASIITVSNALPSALKTMLCTVVPKFLEIARQDQDRTVVMSAVDSLHELLERLGAAVLQATNSTDAILQTMKDIFTHKVSRKGFGNLALAAVFLNCFV